MKQRDATEKSEIRPGAPFVHETALERKRRTPAARLLLIVSTLAGIIAIAACTTEKAGADKVSIKLHIPPGTSRLILVGVGHPATADRAAEDELGRPIHPTSAIVECGTAQRDPKAPGKRGFTFWVAPGPRAEIDDLLRQFDSAEPIAIDALVLLEANSRAIAAARDFAALPAPLEPRLVAGPRLVLDTIAADPIVRDAIAGNRIALRALAPNEKWKIGDPVSIELFAVPNVCLLEGSNRKLLFAPTVTKAEMNDRELATSALSAALWFVNGADFGHTENSFRDDLQDRQGDRARYRFVSLDGRPTGESIPGFSNALARAFVGDEYLF